MGKTILFTPIGGTDPISSTNYQDGSMLHICRVYQPDKIIMYMSKEMLDYQEQDDRYRYCIRLLGEMQKHTYEIEIVERRELTRVHEFDFFYQDFRNIIREIYKELEEDDILLLNVSSGTPAMKSGLLVLQTLGEFPAKLIQVSTPEHRINEHIHDGYDVETLWKLDVDNNENYENRCKEIKCPTLSGIKKEEMIKKHVAVYDYQAALDIADTLSIQETEAYRDMIELASRRLLLDFSGVDKICAKNGVQCLPVRASSDRKYFEYALSVDIKLRKEEYADFVRAITPLIVDLFEMILRKQCNVNVDEYCTVNNRAQSRRWSRMKLEGTRVGEILEKEYQNQFQYKDVYSVHLKTLIENMSQDAELIRLIQNVRRVEEAIRNLAAHQIISVTNESIRQRTGFTAVQIMDMIKRLFSYTGISIKKEYWNSYDRMNQMIIEKMSISAK